MKKFKAFTVIFLLAAFSIAAAAASLDSGCVKCHTDAGRLKALFVAPVLHSEEGEG